MLNFLALSAECLAVASPSNGRQRLRFGLFEADLASGELYKHGHLIHVQEQPFRILAMLLERPGEVVSREEVQKKLWPEGTFVDFDESLDTALKKLRQALGDSPQNPVFVETIPRRGYRFIAPVQDSRNGSGSIADRSVLPIERSEEKRTPGADVAQPTRTNARWLRNVTVAIVSVAAMVAISLVISSFSPPPPPMVSRIVQLSHTSRLDAWGGITTDGARLFFLEREGDHWNSMQMPVSGGETQPLPVPFHNTRIFDISPDMTEFLIAPFTQRGPGLPLWTLPVVGGAPRRLGNIVGDDAVFSPDGARIAYSTADGVYICSRTGTDVKKLASLPDIAFNMAWSPDGKLLRFSQAEQKTTNASLWEVSADGENLHPLLPGWNQPSSQPMGRWSPDGRHYFFLSCQEGEGVCSVWVHREKGEFPYLSRPGPPVRLTPNPLSFSVLVPSHDGRRLFVMGGQNRFELMQQDRHSKLFVARFKGAQIGDARFSPNGDRVALILAEGNLWQSRPDGAERVQLTTGFSQVTDMRWSPDGTRIVFDAFKPGHPWNIYQVQAEGGAIEELLPEDGVYGYPDWSPDGESIVYLSRRDKSAVPPAEEALYVLDLRTRESNKFPGSDGLEYPRWSPDGRYLAATSASNEKVMLYDFQARRWNEIAHGKFLTSLVWSNDSEYLYLEDLLEPSEPIYRIRPTEAQTERVTDFATVLATGATRCQFVGFAPDGSVMAAVQRGGGEVYALDLELRSIAD